jgi:hypothetical protein
MFLSTVSHLSYRAPPKVILDQGFLFTFNQLQHGGEMCMSKHVIGKYLWLLKMIIQRVKIGMSFEK